MPGPKRARGAQHRQSREDRDEDVARIQNILDEASGLCHTVSHQISEIPENQGAKDAWTALAARIDELLRTAGQIAH